MSERDNNMNYNENTNSNQNNEMNQYSQNQYSQQEKGIYVDSIQRDIPNYNYYSSNQDGTQKNNMNEKKAKKERKAMKGFLKLSTTAVAFGLIAGLTFQGVNYFADRSGNNEQIELNVDNSNTDNGTSSNGVSTVQTSTGVNEYSGVSEIVYNVKPSIVAITSTQESVSYDWFGRPTSETVSGAGSGIIIGQSEDEILIVTNNHVIDGATAISIQFNDGSAAEATVKGAEASSDLAVVAVDVKNLSEDTLSAIKIATLGDSDSLNEGELAIAIGNALGYGQSTTVGYVSALNREVSVNGITLNLIQTDAAINPGNSGGALLNAKGEVIGINSVKYVQNEVEGIGYAIPISQAIPIINDLMNREVLEESEKGFLGVIEPEDVTEERSERFNLPVGVYINGIVEGSAADEAGLKRGDVIVGIGGRTIKTAEELYNYLSYTPAGKTVTVDIKTIVEGEYVEKSVDVTLTARADQ